MAKKSNDYFSRDEDDEQRGSKNLTKISKASALEGFQQAIEIAELKVEIEAIKQQQAQVQFRENHITVTDLLDIEADFTQANIDLIQTKHQSIIAQAKYQQSINSDTLRFTTP